MKLYIKQKVFSWGDKFTVKDASGEDRYYVEGEVFSWGKKLHVYDMRGNEAAFIQQKLFTLLPRFFVFVDGEKVAEIVREFTFFFPKYRIEGLGWDINGRFMEHDYEITQDGRGIVTIRKEWLAWGDTYELDIADPKDEIVALAVVLTIDAVTQSNSGVSVSVSGD